MLSEEVILKWYKDGHTPKGWTVFMAQMKKMIEWLEHAESGKVFKTRLSLFCYDQGRYLLPILPIHSFSLAPYFVDLFSLFFVPFSFFSPAIFTLIPLVEVLMSYLASSVMNLFI